MWGLEQDTFVAYAHGGSAPYAKKASPGLLSFLAFAKGKGGVTAWLCESCEGTVGASKRLRRKFMFAEDK